eukprot:6193453-Pleurochrysis_carterae.AAC.8
MAGVQLHPVNEALYLKNFDCALIKQQHLSVPYRLLSPEARVQKTGDESDRVAASRQHIIDLVAIVKQVKTRRLSNR